MDFKRATGRTKRKILEALQATLSTDKKTVIFVSASLYQSKDHKRVFCRLLESLDIHIDSVAYDVVNVLGKKVYFISDARRINDILRGAGCNEIFVDHWYYESGGSKIPSRPSTPPPRDFRFIKIDEKPKTSGMPLGVFHSLINTFRKSIDTVYQTCYSLYIRVKTTKTADKG